MSVQTITGPDAWRPNCWGACWGPAGGSVLLIAGLQEFSGHGERKTGFLDVLKHDFPACRVSIEVNNLDQGPIAADNVAAALTSRPDVSGIYNISQGNDAIAERIERQDRQRPLVFICHDLTPTTKALLLSRRIHAVIDQDPLLEAKRAIELILQHFGRLTDHHRTGSTPLRVFFRENVAGELQ